MIIGPLLKVDECKDNYLDKNGFYQVPQAVCDKLNSKLGNSSAQLRVMWVLCGTKPGFRVSNQWLMDRTGISRENIYKTYHALEEAQFISKNIKDNSITINYKIIMA